MGLQFVTGDLSVDKKSLLIRKLWELHAHNPNARLFYLVPEHLKFDMETEILAQIRALTASEQAAMMDIQVVSFSRLAWALLPDHVTQHQSLSTIGLSMLVRQLLRTHQSSLVVYRGQVHHQGFIEQLVALFTELYEGNVEVDDLQAIATAQGIESDQMYSESQRLNELALLYGAFRQVVEEKNLENFQGYQQLATWLLRQPCQDHYIVIDHHYYFNAQQLNVVLALIQSFNQVWIPLPLTTRQAQTNDWHPLIDTQRHTYQQLRALCRLRDLSVESDLEIVQDTARYVPSIQTVAQYFAKYATYGLPKYEERLDKSRHHIWRHDTLQSELRHVSNQIHYLVTQQGYRYRDILVVARDLDQYGQLVAPLFERNRIPFFFDHASKMAQHPFVIWLESVLNLHRYRWQYKDLMSVLKSDLFVPLNVHLESHRYGISQLENIVLANGYVGYRFTHSTFSWRFDQMDIPYVNEKGQKCAQTYGEVMNDIRQWVLRMLVPLFDQWEVVMSGQQAANWLFALVDATGVKQQLIAMRDQAIEAGDLEASRRHEQVWQVFSQTLEEFYQIYGEDEIDYATFCDVLMAGLSEGTYHVIPPTLDQVTFTSVESPQVHPRKVCFVLGADESMLPQVQVAPSLLTVDNRTQLREVLLPHQYMVNRVTQQTNQELLLAYQLLLSSSEQLYISYVAVKGTQTVQLSPYFQQVVQAFDLLVCSLSDTWGNVQQTSDYGLCAMQITPLLQQIRQYYDEGTAPSDTWISLVQQLPSYYQVLIQQAFHFSELPHNLTPNTAQQLFGKHLQVSVSKIEQFYQDPYSHFLLYGLKLRERQTFEVNSARSGDYFHEFLDRFMKEIMQTKQSLTLMTLPQLQQMAQFIQQQMAEDWRYQVFESNVRMQAIKQQMDQRLTQFIQFTQQQHQQLNGIQTIQTEALFGNGKDALKGLKFDLSSGGTLSIRGKIDRIDAFDTIDGLQVIDYKSGNKSYDIVNHYYGMDLQIMTYLTVALNHYGQQYTQPVGAFYQPLLHRYTEGTSATFTQGLSETERLSDHRLNGVVALPVEMLQRIDRSLNEQTKSLLYPVTLTKKGYSSYTPYYNDAELETLLSYTLHLFAQAGEQIHAGEIGLKPYRTEQYTPTLQSQFRVITGFDATENYQAYREKTIAKKDVIAEMERKLDVNERSE